VSREYILTTRGLLPGCNANEANDPSMRLTADYCELAEVLIESYEYPLFEIRS